MFATLVGGVHRTVRVPSCSLIHFNMRFTPHTPHNNDQTPTVILAYFPYRTCVPYCSYSPCSQCDRIPTRILFCHSFCDVGNLVCTGAETRGVTVVFQSACFRVILIVTRQNKHFESPRDPVFHSLPDTGIPPRILGVRLCRPPMPTYARLCLICPPMPTRAP